MKRYLTLRSVALVLFLLPEPLDVQPAHIPGAGSSHKQERYSHSHPDSHSTDLSVPGDVQDILCTGRMVLIECMCQHFKVVRLIFFQTGYCSQPITSSSLFLQDQLFAINKTQKHYMNKTIQICVCVFQCQPTALLRASGSTQGG